MKARLLALVIGLGLALLQPIIAAGQSGQQPGRFQLVPENQGTMFLLDTATGRVWRYTKVTGPGGQEVESPCRGLVTCFVEIDRLRLSDAGYGSEIVSPKK